MIPRPDPAALAALKAGEGLSEAGIRVERLPDGDLRFSVNVMVDRTRIHRVVGRESEGVGREQAERLVEKLRTDAREGRLDLPAGRKTRLIFAEGAAEYLTRLERSGGKQIDRKRQQLSGRLVPHFGRKTLGRIATSDIEEYAKSRVDAGARASTVNRESRRSHTCSAGDGMEADRRRRGAGNAADNCEEILSASKQGRCRIAAGMAAVGINIVNGSNDTIDRTNRIALGGVALCAFCLIGV